MTHLPHSLKARSLLSLPRWGAGLLTALGLAAGAQALGGVVGLHPLLLAIVLGMVLAPWLPTEGAMAPGLSLAARGVLRFGISLLGLQITAAQVMGLGPMAFVVAGATLWATFFFTRSLGRWMGVSPSLSDLVAAGTAVCGASAVAAANGVVRADRAEVGYALGIVTLCGTGLMLILPLLAGLMGIDPHMGGIWIGASLQDVSQATAAAFQLGPEAGQAGTMTKLIRVAMLAPVILVLAGLARRAGGQGAAARTPIPWFVVGFVALVAVNSLISLPEVVARHAGPLSQLCLATGMAAMGLQIRLGALRAQGVRPLILGMLASIFVAGFALAMTWVTGA